VEWNEGSTPRPHHSHQATTTAASGQITVHSSTLVMGSQNGGSSGVCDLAAVAWRVLGPHTTCTAIGAAGCAAHPPAPSASLRAPLAACVIVALHSQSQNNLKQVLQSCRLLCPNTASTVHAPQTRIGHIRISIIRSIVRTEDRAFTGTIAVQILTSQVDSAGSRVRSLTRQSFLSSHTLDYTVFQ